MVGSCCAQLLKDFDLTFYKVLMFCDNTNAITLSKNPFQHCKAKHIELSYQFIRYHIQNGDISIEFIGTFDRLADILTKRLKEDRLYTITRQLGTGKYRLNFLLQN